MSLRLRLRLVLSVLLGALLVVTVGAALQFREIATLAEEISALDSAADEQARRTADTVRAEATTAALGLGMLGAMVLVLGAWITRAARVTLFDRLAAMDHATERTEAGEPTRRIALPGDDELARVAAAFDRMLDLRDRTEAAMQGRNREVRALLVALLHRWPRPAAVTGIDGEIIVSTLSGDEEDALRSIAPQVRAAARTLLSRHFLTAAELATDLRIDARHVVSIRALALEGQRIVGWLATFGPTARA